MEDKNKYYTFYVIKRIWKNYASGSMKLLLIALFCNAIVALTTPALPELIRRVIDDIFVNSNREMLTILPLIAILIMFIRALGTYGANVAINYIGQKIVGFLQKDLYKAILNSDMSYINSIHSARFISSFTADTTKLRETMSSVVVNLSRNILMVLGLVGYLFYVDPTLATIFFLVLPPAAIGLRMLGKRLRKAIRMSLEEIGTLSALVSETLKGMRIIRAFGKERIHSEKASSIIDQVVSLSMKGVRARSASAPIMEIVTGFAIAGIIYYAGNKSLDGLMSVGSFMAFTTAAGLLYDPLKAVANLQAMLQEGVAASQRLFPILDNKPKGIFLSNGPGDPAAVDYGISTVKELLGIKPIFGICLGHQILALALGGETYKLKFGHRGCNHPVKNLANGKIEITSQNHGFSVKADSNPKRFASPLNISKSVLESANDSIDFLLATIVGSLGFSIISFLSSAVFAGSTISACRACAFHQISLTITVSGFCHAFTSLFKS